MARHPRQKAVPVFPSGRQALGPLPKDMAKKSNPSTAKLRFRTRLCFHLFWNGFISPIFNAAALFQFIAQAIGFWALFILFGPKKLTEMTTGAAAAFAGFAGAMVCWTAIQAFLAPMRIQKEEKSIGTWQGNRFVFNEARRVFTTEWSPADNGTYQTIVIPDVESDALVDYRIDIDGPASRLNCLILGAYYFSPVQEIVRSTRFAPSGRVRLKKDHSVTLHCFSKPDTVPAIVRVYILAWEVDHKILLDYTDLSGDSRVVLAPPAS
ncbi:MAG TPA: hypothetical protein VKD19_08405 [Pseudolabrys sp.]|nr:hypothetical protein [Pseudolabrys sp.]